MRSEQVEWIIGEGGHACRFRQCLCDRSLLDFKLRCAEKLEQLGDTAVDAQQYDDASARYSAALSLDPAIPRDVLIKRSKVYVAMGLWEEALDDTDQVCHSVLCGSDPLDAEDLGDSARSVVYMGLREGVDGVGESKIDTCVMEECVEIRRGCKCSHLLTCTVKLTFRFQAQGPEIYCLSGLM